MRLLLDTHVVLWMFGVPHRLSDAASRALRAPEAELMVSAVSAYEAAQRRFREPVLADVAAVLPELVDGAGLGWMPLTPAQAYAAGRLDWAHRDPFDRMLVAQARDLGAVLVTADAELQAHDVPTLW